MNIANIEHNVIELLIKGNLSEYITDSLC